MKAGMPTKRQAPFQFVLAELSSVRPVVRQMFGFTYVYLDDKLLLSLRQSVKQPHYNGVWLYTQAEHIASLRQEFPLLPRRYFWRSAKSGAGWVFLAAECEDFEEYAYWACELILRGDQRLGRVTRKGWHSTEGGAANKLLKPTAP